VVADEDLRAIRPDARQQVRRRQAEMKGHNGWREFVQHVGRFRWACAAPAAAAAASAHTLDEMRRQRRQPASRSGFGVGGV
jgi:hypothetical protein